MPPHRFPASLAPLLPLGRWSPTPTNGLAASWPGSSLTLRFTGSYLALDGGRETARLGRPGGEEKTLTWTVFCPGRGELEGAPAPGNTGTVRTANLRNGERVVLWDQPGEGEERVCRVYIGDWGSVVEVAAFFADEETSLLPPSPAPQTRILTIGDSISCAYSMGSEWGQKVPPHGAWDAWPLLAGRIISARALAQGQGQGQGEGQLVRAPPTFLTRMRMPMLMLLRAPEIHQH
ncbi:hypothetical protein CALCODRAFT_504721 [Calocera cornea HHB12733]|uniref:SGNH hydrolase-type esterase domain-containing protein n=1 Tax=Calocera cornea HHB12733 TaxID=1353952 RepID=A0A165C9J5_9BASI|nr:hypothetical protein CALCODRAFT_504721 [Calocera cornea HHB12733]